MLFVFQSFYIGSFCVMSWDFLAKLRSLGLTKVGLKHWLSRGGSVGPHNSESKQLSASVTFLMPSSLLHFVSSEWPDANRPVSFWSSCVMIVTSSLCCDAFRVAALKGNVRMKFPTLTGGMCCPFSAVRLPTRIPAGLWLPLWITHNIQHHVDLSSSSCWLFSMLHCHLNVIITTHMSITKPL